LADLCLNFFRPASIIYMDPQLIINGIALGSIIAPAAVGLTLTYGILKLSNFAHGDFLTLGAYLAWFVNSLGVSIPIAIGIGMVGTILAMLLSDVLLWTPMRQKRASTTTIMISSIGLSLFLRSLLQFIWGAKPQKYNLPLELPYQIAGLNIKNSTLVTLFFSALAIGILYLVLQKTKIGKAMRAVADDPDLAKVTGIDVQQVVLWTWIITGALTALAGGLYGLESVRLNMGWYLILPMFAAAILGGIGNPYGAIAGAFIIGLVQELSFPLVGADFKLAVALVVMVLTLLFRPQGLFKGLM
jgi:neutral amino acid transport system permease protein